MELPRRPLPTHSDSTLVFPLNTAERVLFCMMAGCFLFLSIVWFQQFLCIAIAHSTWFHAVPFITIFVLLTLPLLYFFVFADTLR